MSWGRTAFSFAATFAASALGLASCLAIPSFSVSPNEQPDVAGGEGGAGLDGGPIDASSLLDGRRADAEPGTDAETDAGLQGDGSTPQDAAPDGSDPRRYRVFVSSTTKTGELGGIAGADLLCQNLGNMRPPAAIWRAFLWTGPNLNDAPENRINVPSNGFYQMPLVGQNPTVQVFGGGAGALGGNPIQSLGFDEMGIAIPSVSVWVGSASGTRCGEWTNPAMGLSTNQGTSNSIVALRWRLTADGNCATAAHLYCFEQ